jgi:hypothetical protein
MPDSGGCFPGSPSSSSPRSTVSIGKFVPRGRFVRGRASFARERRPRVRTDDFRKSVDEKKISGGRFPAEPTGIRDRKPRVLTGREKRISSAGGGTKQSASRGGIRAGRFSSSGFRSDSVAFA